MPVAAFPFSSTEFSIFNGIYYKIIQDVAERVGVKTDSLSVLYRDIEYAKTDNDTTISIQSTENRPKTASKRRLSVRVTPEYDEDTIDTTAVHRDEHYPIFNDETIGVRIAPVYIQMKVNLEFTYTSPSKTELGTMADMIRIHLSRFRDIGHHEVEYTMIIPVEVEQFIEDIHTLRNRLIPQELGDYFKEHSTPRIHAITDMANKENIRLGVAEKQGRIIGTYDFKPTPPRPTPNTDNATHSFSFNYSFSVSIPRAVSVRYNAMICNRLLPNCYLDFVEEAAKSRHAQLNKSYLHIGRSNQALSKFEAHRQLGDMTNINLPINVPAFDDFDRKQFHRGYGVRIAFLLEVDEADKRTLFNLRELGDYALSDKVLEYITGEGRDKVVVPYASFLYIGLHQEGKFFDKPLLEITPNLDVRCKEDLDLTKPTRVTFSTWIDSSSFSDSVLGNLQADPDLFKEAMVELIEGRYFFVTFIKNIRVADVSLFEMLGRYFQYLDSIDQYAPIAKLLKLILMYDSRLVEEFLDTVYTLRPALFNRLLSLRYLAPYQGSVGLRSELNLVTYRVNNAHYVFFPDQDLTSPTLRLNQSDYVVIPGDSHGIFRHLTE